MKLSMLIPTSALALPVGYDDLTQYIEAVGIPDDSMVLAALQEDTTKWSKYKTSTGLDLRYVPTYDYCTGQFRLMDISDLQSPEACVSMFDHF